MKQQLTVTGKDMHMDPERPGFLDTDLDRSALYKHACNIQCNFAVALLPLAIAVVTSSRSAMTNLTDLHRCDDTHDMLLHGSACNAALQG